MDKIVFGSILYHMQKRICNEEGWSAFLESLGISEQEWHEIKLHLEVSHGIKTYA